MNEAESWLVGFGRFGFVAKGVVYTLMGVLAVRVAIGAGGEIAGKTGVLEEIGKAPFGRYLLIATGVGIVGYALWRCIQAVWDTENKGTGGKGLAVRAGYFILALIHVGLAAAAFRLVSGGSAGESDSTQGWTVRVMSHEFGEWLVAGAGIAVLAYGAWQLYRGYSLKFCKKLKMDEMNSTERKWATRLGAIGYVARGIVFGTVGVFLMVAVIHSDPQEARGLDGALATLAQQPWGSALLAAVAAGLAAYGVYMFVEARYRRMVIDR